MSELFKIKETKYNLRRENTIVVSNVPTTRYGIDSISYLGPKASNESADTCQLSVYALYEKHPSSGLRSYVI